MLVCKCQKVGKEGKFVGTRRGTGSPLSKSKKAVLQGRGKVSKLFLRNNCGTRLLKLELEVFIVCFV